MRNRQRSWAVEGPLMSHVEAIDACKASVHEGLAGVEGPLSISTHYSGLSVHANDTRELRTMETQFVLPPGLSLTILLRGQLEFWLDDQHCFFDAATGPAQCILIYGQQPRTIRRCMRLGRTVCKLNISVGSQWLEEYQITTRSLQALDAWPASHRSVSLAGELISAQKLPATQSKIITESRALELLADMLNRGSKRSFGNTRERSLIRAKDYIDAKFLEIVNIDEVAAVAGVSLSTLQRQFKAKYQSTVADYIRSCRLNWVKSKLERGELTIGEAAFCAGYNHVSNFISAYKRKFGATPGKRAD